MVLHFVGLGLADEKDVTMKGYDVSCYKVFK